MKCSKCGENVDVNSKFCRNCGADFSIVPMINDNFNNGQVRFGPFVYIWLILCIAIQSLTVIRLLSYNIYFMPVVAMLSIISNLLLLLCKKKVFFYFIIISVVAIFVTNIVSYDVPVYSAVLGFLNPLVTFLIIKKYWEYM